MDQSAGNLVVGIGSLHGDDAIGLHVLEEIRGQNFPGLRFLASKDPLQMLSNLEHCQRLWILDACRSGKQSGSLTRYQWPFDAETVRVSSTHAMGLIDALLLAERLGTVPKLTVLYGIEICEEMALGSGVSQELADRIPDITKLIVNDIFSSLSRHVPYYASVEESKNA